MISTDQIQNLVGRGRPVIGNDGTKIGKIGQVYIDDQSGQPEWVTVNTGFFSTAESFIPLDQAYISEDDELHVPYTKEYVKDAPRIEHDGRLEQTEEDGLYSYYNMQRSSWMDDEEQFDAASTTGYDTSGPTTDRAMTRSEERLNVGTENREMGRARLRKYVVTEQQNVQVPVSREEVRLEREPITDGNIGEAMSGPDISDEEHEVVLHEEVPVVNKETVPVERVRMGKETVTDQETISDEVRKEQIELDDQTRKGRKNTL